MAIERTEIKTFKSRDGQTVYYPKTSSDAVLVDNGDSLTNELAYRKWRIWVYFSNPYFYVIEKCSYVMKHSEEFSWFLLLCLVYL